MGGSGAISLSSWIFWILLATRLALLDEKLVFLKHIWAEGVGGNKAEGFT